MVLGSCHTATLVNKTAAELLHCSELARRDAAHYAVGEMTDYAACISMRASFIASRDHEGSISGSAQLRDLLA